MVLSNSEMSKNISFHIALCAKGFNQGWREGAGLKVNHDRGGFCPLELDKAKEENLGTVFSCCSLPKKKKREGVGKMRWSGPWKAESGIHPDSRNNLLIFFQKGDSLSKMAG